MTNSFQWLVALRYLRMERPRSLKIHWISFGLGMALLVAYAGSAMLDASLTQRAQEFRVHYGVALRLTRIGILVGFVLIVSFIVLVRRLTIFTTISTYGLFLGSGALVIVLSVMSGFESDLRHKILGANAHIVVTTPDRPFTEYEAARAKLAKLKDVVGVTPFITSELMVASQTNLSGVILKAIDPATVAQVTDLQKNLDIGELDYLSDPEKLRGVGGVPLLKRYDFEPQPGPDAGAAAVAAAVEKTAKRAEPPPPRKAVPGVIVGRELAKNLRVYLGDDVSLVSPLGGVGPSGPIPKSKPFRIAGIFFSGMFEYDSKYVYLSIPAAQKFLSQDDEVTGLELKVRDPDRSEATVKAIEEALGAGRGYEIKDWKELNRNLFSALKLEKIAMFIVLCFIILVAAFSIIANGIMLVVEKGREIAILKSMGASDQAILVVFLILGLYMGGLGTMAGIALGIAVCLLLGHFGISLDPDVYYITQLPVRLNPNEIATVFAAAILIALLATMYPAWLAARLKPVEGLREGNH